jgi:hypothetical protein
MRDTVPQAPGADEDAGGACADDDCLLRHIRLLSLELLVRTPDRPARNRLFATYEGAAAGDVLTITE